MGARSGAVTLPVPPRSQRAGAPIQEDTVAEPEPIRFYFDPT